jgi:hypothetical protein
MMNTPYAYAPGCRGRIETLPEIGRRVRIADGREGIVTGNLSTGARITVVLDDGNHAEPSYGSAAWEYAD